MIKNQLLDNQFEHYKAIINDVFKELHQLTTSIKNDKLSETVDTIRARLNEPFLFVIAGEVKVGKSSFVNALLEADKEVCKVAPDPCTDVIQQIVYGEEESTIVINEYLKKITIPVDILKKVAIVDTPGTNTIIDHHQEITEKFIPVSDLIIFVFEAKNPYRQSAWEFFNYINKEWRKKVIFVLQQSDLMEDDDLVINKRGVEKYAFKNGITDPKVFCVSAKQELKGDTQNSGFKAIREFIRMTVTGGNNVRMKVQSLMSTSQKITANIKEGIIERRNQLDVDNQFRRKVNLLLDNAESKSASQIESLIELELLKEYDKITGSIRTDFEEGLGVFTLIKKSFLSIFSKKESMKEWIDRITGRIEKELKPTLENKLREGVINIGDSIRQMAEIIDGEIRKNKALKSNHQVFGDIADKRQEKLEKLQNNIEDLIEETGDFLNSEMLEKSSALVPNMATGGGLVVIGAILAGVVQGVAFDVTGGVLSVIGLSIAGLVTAVQRRRIMRDFDEEIAKGRDKLDIEVDDKLKAYVKEIRTKIDNNFLEFDAFMSEEEENLNGLKERYENIESKFNKLVEDLELELN